MESFNARLRDHLLAGEIFFSREEARLVIRAPDASPFDAIKSRYIRRFPTGPTVKALICARVSAFRTPRTR